MNARSVFGLMVLGLGTLVAPLDSAVNIAFPFITGAFGVPLASIQWVVICYVLTHTSLMLIFGKLGDLFGYKRIFRAGLALSILTLALCASAWTFEWLLVFRVAQGISAALVMSCGPALATSLFPERHRARVLGIYILMYAIGGALGPCVGGALVAEWGWAAVYWFRTPLALAALLLLFVLPEPRHGDDARGFDVWGAVLAALAMCILLLTVTQLHRFGDQPIVVVVLAVLGALALVGFIRRQVQVAEPIMRLAIFRQPEFSILNMANVVVNLVGFSVLLLVPYYLARVTEFPVVIGGLILAMTPLGSVLGAPAGGWIIGRAVANRVAFVGALLVAFGQFLIASWPVPAGIGMMMGSLLTVGIGLGLFQVAYMNIVTGSLARRDRGVAGSLAMLTRTVGIVGAASLLTWLFSHLEMAAAGQGIESFLHAFQATFRWSGGILIAFTLCTMLRPRVWLGRAGAGGA